MITTMKKTNLIDYISNKENDYQTMIMFEKAIESLFNKRKLNKNIFKLLYSCQRNGINTSLHIKDLYQRGIYTDEEMFQAHESFFYFDCLNKIFISKDNFDTLLRIKPYKKTKKPKRI